MDNNSREEVQHIIQIALQGEALRGDNGAVLIDNDHTEPVYLLSHEFQPQEFSEQLNELLTEDERKHIFVVYKMKDAMHISKIPRGV